MEVQLSGAARGSRERAVGVFLITQVAAQCRHERATDRNCVTLELPLTPSGRDDPSAA